MSKPLVSIIIPVYNGENYLTEAIESALNQTYKNIEIIVINDGSTDSTEEICLQYGNKIRYFYKENGGVSSALNLGISKMKGVYFSWLSHDDLYIKEKVSIQIQKLEEYDFKYKVVFAKANTIDGKGALISSSRNKKHKILTSRDFYKKNIFKMPNGCSFLIHKDVLKSVGEFNEGYKFIQDADYWQRIALNKFSVISLRKSIVKSRVHPNQATVYLKHRYSDELNDMLKKESNIMLLSEDYSDFLDLLYLRLSILGNRKLKKKVYLKHKQKYKVKLVTKIKYHYTTLIGTTIYLLKKIKIKYIDLRYR